MAGLCVYGSDRNMNTRLILFVVARHVLSPCPASIVLLYLFWFSGLILFPHLFTFWSVLTAIFTSLKMFAFILLLLASTMSELPDFHELS